MSEAPTKGISDPEKFEIEQDAAANNSADSSEVEFIAEVKAEPQEFSFTNYTPESMSATGTIQKHKKADTIAQDDSDSSDLPEDYTEAIKRPPAKKTRSSASTKATEEKNNTKKQQSSTQDTPNGIEFNIAYHIAKQVLNKGKKKPKDSEAWLQRPGFTFTTDKLYEEFLSAVADALPCTTKNLVEDSFYWRPSSPASTSKLLVGNATGYAAMISHVEKNLKGRHILLYMDPPLKPSVTAPKASTSRDTEPSPAKKNFDYAVLEYASTSNHIVQQR
ncbi:hypothetical protein V5O48_017442, partial [Marasmius crinis-equi]